MSADYSPRQVSELIASADVQLVDVRSDYEHEAGRIDAGTHIELGALSERASELDPQRPVVFYCRSGGRSAMATQAFTQAGFDAHNMSGGLLEWVAAGLPIVPDGGHVADP